MGCTRFVGYGSPFFGNLNFMVKLSPVNYKKLVKVFEYLGFCLDRQEGDHLIYIKKGIKRPIVIPIYNDIPVFIIKNNLDSAGVSRKDYFNILEII